MIQLLKRIDQFGVPFTINIQKQEKQFKSAIGGIVSLILYAACLVYLIYKLYLWQTNQIIPKMSVIQTTKVYDEIQFDEYDPISITMKLGGEINPFQEDNNVITPYIFYVDGTSFTQPERIPLGKDPTPGFSNTVTPKNMSLVLNQNAVSEEYPRDQRQAFIVFEKCDAAKMTGLQKCADQETVTAFFQQPLNMFFVNIGLKQFKPESQSYESIYKQIYLVVEEETSLFGQILFGMRTNIVNDGLFLDSFETTKYVSDFEFINQQLSVDTFTRSLQMNVVAGFLIRLDSIQSQSIIMYAKIGEILADVGSIMSTLLILRIFVVMINTMLMQDTIYNKIITFYYPEFSQIQIQRNYVGKIKSVSRGKKELDLVEFNKAYEIMKTRAANKLSLTNQVYEISRLQFILQSLQYRTDILNSHKIGIKLPEFRKQDDEDRIHDETKIQLPIGDQGGQQYKLIDADFGLLDEDGQGNSVESQGTNIFYKLNTIV